MKKTKRALFIIGGLVLVIILAAIVYQRKIAQKAVPDYNKNLNLEGLRSEVVVYRDSLGIPHIYASNQQDLYRATGYVMAQERLWQMDLLRRVTHGRLSEIFGADFVRTDMLFRALRFSKKSKMLTDSISPEVMRSIKAFTAGINQFIVENQHALPPEFTLLDYKPAKWEVYHTINLIGYMAWDLSGSWNTETILYKLKSKLDSAKYSDLLPDMKLFSPPVYAQEQEAVRQLSEGSLMDAAKKVNDLVPSVFTGSNNWAVAPEKSKNGGAMLANDMHLGLNVPGIWMQMHQVIPGELNVTGVALPGAPYVICGHNASIAWGMTNVMLDDIDFYHETINPRDTNQYKVNGKWRDMQVQKEIIRTDEGKRLERHLRFTHRGPVISGFKDTEATISMRWIGNSYSNELRTVYLLNYATNWQDFKNAVRTFRAISQNIAYADTAGNIGMYTCAGIPVRETAGYRVFPGDTTLYDWNGFVPFEELPHEFNPERNFVYSANNKITGPDYPYYISYWYDMPYRARRIRNFLSAKDKLSATDFKTLQTDHYSLLAKDMTPVLLKALSEQSLNATEQKAQQLLDEWNYKSKAEKAAPMIFEETYLQLVENLVLDEMGDKLYKEYLNKDFLVNYVIGKLLNGASSSLTNDRSTEQNENFEDLLVVSFKNAIDRLKKDLGDNPGEWQWGQKHQLILKHPLSEVPALERIFDLNRGPYPLDGTSNTVCPGNFSLNNPYKVDHGPSQRHIYPAANWDEGWSVIPTGISGIPASPHYCDQTRRYVNLEYHREFFSKKAVKRNHKYLMRFVPKKKSQ